MTSGIFLTIVLLLNNLGGAIQKNSYTLYTRQIASQNLAPLWHNTRLQFPESSQEWDAFPEPLGFIGTEYQRFYIHYTSVIKDPANPYRYNVQGKTKVKDHICRFSGTITVVEARLYQQKNTESPQYSEGEVRCRVDLWEDKNQAASGHINGKLVSYWYLNKKNKVQYNTLDAVSDGFANNQCTAMWTSYRNGITKTCNWGDYRIPESGNLDVGAGEFYVSDKYVANGWQYYNKALTAGEQNKLSNTAQAEEKRKWWQ